MTRKWMDDAPDLAGVLDVDGHVRLYNGKERFPKQYVSRDHLCLRGVMDFWVNNMLWQPFFVVRAIVNPGVLRVLREIIVPRLLKEVPNQPTEEALKADTLHHRFIIDFDREGYSPGFFKAMWKFLLILPIEIFEAKRIKKLASKTVRKPHKTAMYGTWIVLAPSVAVTLSFLSMSPLFPSRRFTQSPILFFGRDWAEF